MGDLLAVPGVAHLKEQVLQRPRLRHLPTDTRRHQWLVVVGRAQGHLSEIEFQIPDLAEEVVLVRIPICPVAAGDVRVSVDDGNALERIAALARRWQGR